MHGKLFQSFSNSLFTKVENFCEKSFLSRLFKLHYRWLKNEISRVTKIVYMFVKKKMIFQNQEAFVRAKWTQFFDIVWHCKTVYKI